MKKMACFMTRCTTLFRLVVIIVLLNSCCMAQQPMANYYSNGQIRTLVIKTGVDSVEYTSYYSTGRKREHFFYILPITSRFLLASGSAITPMGKCPCALTTATSGTRTLPTMKERITTPAAS